MKKNKKPESMILRQKAEELLKDKPSEQEAQLLDAEILKLVHELEVYKVELELQYEEFVKAKKEQETIASEKYIELYNLEPTGYFTLSRNGEIIQLNNSGAKMLGKDKSQLENRLFHLFVSDNSKPTFLFFLGKVFTSGKNESCELTLSTNDDMPVYVYLTGIVSKNSDNSLITVIDITERKLLESSLIEKMIMLSETERAGKIGGWTIDVKTFTQNWTLETFKIFEIDTIRGEPNVIDFIEMIDGPFRLNAELVIQRAVEFGEPFNYEWKMTTVKGNKRWINAVGKANMVNGKTVSLSGAFQDISERKQAEEALLESELKFRNIFENSPVGISMTNLDGFLNVNNAFCSILGYSKEELSKLKWQDITYPDDIIQAQKAIDSLLSGVNLNIRFEKRYFHKNGNIIWAHLSSTLQCDINRKPLYLMTTIIDITEKKQAEALLKESEKKYHAIFDNVQDVFYQTDLAGTVLDVSPSIKILSGFNRDEIIDKPVTNLYYDLKDRDKVLGLLKENGELRDFELRLKTNTGELKFVSINARLIFDSEGKPNHIDGAIRNITDRKLAEIELQASKDFLNSIINAVASPVFVKDENHKCVLVNNALSSFLEIPKEKIIGSTDSEYFPEEQVKVFIEKENEVLKTGKENCSEEFVTDKTGNVRTIVTRKTLYTDTAGNKFLVGVINEITERKLSENALKESQLLLKSSIESPKDMNVLSIDKQYKYLYFNTYHKNVMLSAYGKDVKIGMNLLDCISNEDDIIKSKINYGRAFNGESHTTIDEYGEHTRYYYETRYNPILNDKNEVIGATAFSFNITERKLTEKHIERLNRVYTVLSNINKTIIRVRDKQLLFEEACRIAVENGGFKMAWMGMVNPVTNKIEVVASSGKTGEYLNDINIDLNNEALNSGPAGRTIKSGKCNFSNNIQTDDRTFYWREKALEYGFRSIIALPVIVWGKTIGVYMIYSGEINFFNEDEIKLLEEMASDISFAVEFIESDKERKQAEVALRESTRMLRDSQAVAHIGAYVNELTANEFEANTWKATPEIYKIFGIDETYPHTLAGWVGFIHPDSREELLAYHYQVVAERKRFDHEYKIIRINDGEERWVHGTGELEFDNQHNPIRMLGTIQDITDRKLSEAELIEKEVQFRNLSNAGLALIWTSGTDKLCNYFNEKWLAFTGRKLEQEMGNGWATGVHPDDFDRCVETYFTAFDKREPFEMEYRLLHVSGEYRWLLDIGSPNYKSTGEFIGYIGNCFDITDRKRTEEALRKSEAIQSKIVSNIGDVIVIIDKDGINRYKSPNIETLFGWKPEELIGKSTWNVVHPDDLDSAQKIVAEIALIPNASETTEIRYRRKDGEYVWIEITIVNLLSDPEIQGFLGNYHDITDRMLAQENIRKKDLEFKKLSSNLPDLIFQFTRRPDGTYYVPIASDGIENIFGCQPEDVVDDFTPISRVIHPEDFYRVIADIEYSAKHLTFFTCEFRVLIPGKPVQWIYSKSTPEKLPDGSVTWYGFNADITERKRAENSLMKLKTAIDKSEISVIITDRNGNIEFANPFFTKLTGYLPEEYIGKTPRILKSEYHPIKFYEDMWNTINSGKTWEGEFYNRNKNGEMYWENAIISPVENGNKEITHFVAIKTDITHAKNINAELIIAKERAEESDRLKSAFLANMSHEIRTPMNGILGFTDLLKEPDLPDDQRNYFIGIIEKSGERLLNIINDIIDISKIESGLMKVKNSGINVNEYLNQILTFFKPEAEAKNIKLICKPGLPAVEAFLETDCEKFYAILINLVKNALKYTETGFVEFGYNRVVETQNVASLQLQFYVKDTGIGIPKDRQEAIFERFVQADIVDKMARQGAGLGLSISKAYVEMLRGKIWLESEAENLSTGKSGGSTFYFTMPITAKHQSENNNTFKIMNPAKEVQINPKVSGLKIIIAEDDETSSTLISIGVREFVKEVIKVQNGREAVEACRNNPDIDLILMDIQMPELNGYEATRQIRQFNTEVTIIAITAFALAGDREKTIEAGCNNYISKPVKMDELLEMIQKYFRV